MNSKMLAQAIASVATALGRMEAALLVMKNTVEEIKDDIRKEQGDQ